MSLTKLNLPGPFIYRVLILTLIWLLFSVNSNVLYYYTNKLILDFLQTSSLSVISFLGFDSFSDGRLFGIIGSTGVILGVPCDGLSLMYVYASFIIAFSGSFKRKITWILSGTVMILLLNITRIVSLIIINFRNPELLSFNHDYLFTCLMYGLIFAAWLFYARLNDPKI